MKQFSTYFLTLILFLTGILACTDVERSDQASENREAETFDLKEARQHIQERTKAFTRAHITKDTAFLNNIITKDARSYPPHSDPVIGRKDIAALNEAWVNYGIKEFNEETIAFYGDENYLIDEGNYFLRYGEDDVTDKGKYINIWTKEDGEWKICGNIWNTSLPMADESAE